MSTSRTFSWKRDLLPLWSALFLIEMGYGTIIPLLPLFIQQLGVTDPVQVKLWAGAMSSGQMAGMALMALIWGQLADRYGRKLMVLRTVVCLGTIILLIGLASAAWQVLVLRLLQGFLTGTVVAFTVMVAVTVPKDRVGMGLGTLQTAGFCGYGLGPLVGGMIADQWGYRTSAFVGAGLALASTLIVLFFVHERYPPVKPATRLTFSTLKSDLRIAVANRVLLALALGMLLLRLMMSLPEVLVPLYVQELVPLSSRLATTAGGVASAAAVSSALASLVVGRLSDRHGYARLVLACAAGAVLLYLPQPFVRQAWQLLWFQACVGFFVGGLVPTMNALVSANTAGGNEGVSFGMAYTASNVGLALGPALGSGIASLLSTRAAFGATAGLAGLLTLWAIAQARRSATSRERPSGRATGP